MVLPFNVIAANIAKVNLSAKAAGDVGQALAVKWFRDAGLAFIEIEQSVHSKPKSLSNFGGKRPDFALCMNEGESVVYVDAKFHQTKNLTEFVLTETEIAEYAAFREWTLNEQIDVGDRDVFFMLFPKELYGNKFAWIHLEEIAGGQPTDLNGKDARRLDLTNRDDLWCLNL
jgi:hypothetical protein